MDSRRNTGSLADWRIDSVIGRAAGDVIRAVVAITNSMQFDA